MGAKHLVDVPADDFGDGVPMNAVAKSVGRRPKLYDPEIAAELCERIATEKTNIRDILKSDERFPSYGIVLRWLAEANEFKAMYAHARRLKMQLYEEEILEIADNDNADVYIATNEKTGEQTAKIDGEAIQRSKLRVDTRRWIMSKLDPYQYGDQLDITSGGEKLPAPAAPVVDARMQSLIVLAQQRLTGGKSEELPAIEDLMS